MAARQELNHGQKEGRKGISLKEKAILLGLTIAEATGLYVVAGQIMANQNVGESVDSPVVPVVSEKPVFSGIYANLEAGASSIFIDEFGRAVDEDKVPYDPVKGLMVINPHMMTINGVPTLVGEVMIQP